MGRLGIRTYPDKILRKKATPLKQIGDAERNLAIDMIETMRSANGVGLAAPQVGVSKRIIIIEDVENKNNSLALALFNPKIVKKKGKSSFCEGCLSVPQVTADIVRSERILVEALNREGESVRIDAKGLFATILQHEIDHLDGILFIDRVGFFKRKKILKEISNKICMEL